MTDITFRSDMGVAYVAGYGSDHMIVQAARVSTLGSEAIEAHDTAGDAGLIRYLLKHQHASPFRHNGHTFFFNVPLFIMRQMVRHHVGVDWNEESGRYGELSPTFWTPSKDRPMVKAANYKPARPVFDVAPGEVQHDTKINDYGVCGEAWFCYKMELGTGVAPEVARRLLPQSIYVSAYGTFNLNSIITFLSKRQSYVDPDTGIRSYPQAEVEDVAQQMEMHMQRLYPVTHAEWVKLGRKGL